MIKYNSNNINDWYYDTSDIIKVYHNGAVCYYKIDNTVTPSAQTPCYAVVDNISQYSSTEFDKVYDKASQKWYMLNNLNEFEEYGIYGSGRTITYYNGKLTIDGDYEYQYSGGSWVNVGEISGSSYIDYIELPSTAPYAGMELVTVPSSSGTPMYYEADFLINVAKDQRIIGHASEHETFNNQAKFCTYSSFPYFDYGGGRLSSSYSNIGSAGSRMHLGFGVFSGDSKVEIRRLDNNTRITSTTATPKNVLLPLLCGANYNYNVSGDTFSDEVSSKGIRYYGLKIYDNNVLVGNYIPAKNPSTNEYILYDTITNQYASKIGTGTIIGHEAGGGVVYPVYYEQYDTPEDNVKFDSMIQANEYECPYYNMNSIIYGEPYLYTTSNNWKTKYDWVVTEGYICDSGDKYQKLEYSERHWDETYTGLGEYEKGEMIESGSTDCANQFINLSDIIASSTTSGSPNFYVSPPVGPFDKIRFNLALSAKSGSYCYIAFSDAEDGTDVGSFNANSIGAIYIYGKMKNYVTDANGSQTFAHWVDENHTIVEVDVESAWGNISQLYLFMYQQNVNPAAFSFKLIN